MDPSDTRMIANMAQFWVNEPEQMKTLTVGLALILFLIIGIVLCFYIVANIGEINSFGQFFLLLQVLSNYAESVSLLSLPDYAFLLNLLAYDWKQLICCEELECRSPSPATECFPLEEVVTDRGIGSSISSEAAADERASKVQTSSEVTEKDGKTETEAKTGDAT